MKSFKDYKKVQEQEYLKDKKESQEEFARAKLEMHKNRLYKAKAERQIKRTQKLQNDLKAALERHNEALLSLIHK